MLPYLAIETNSVDIGEIWAGLVGGDSKWMADLLLASLCFGCCLYYSTVIGDILEILSFAAKPNVGVSRRASMLVLVTVGMLLPLCLIEDLSALQSSSFLGVAGVIFTLILHIKRMLDKSYTPGHPLYDDLPKVAKPSWYVETTGSQNFGGKFNLFGVDKGTLVFINILYLIFLGHHNTIKYYKELEDASPERYRNTILTAYSVVFLIFTSVMITGYCVFGQATQPIILNNFHPNKDVLATVARIVIGGALCRTYPLVFSSLKSAVFELLDFKHRSKTVKDAVSMLILTLITYIACRCNKNGMVVILCVVGSLFACVFANILPASLRLASMKKQKQLRGLFPPENQLEVFLNHILLMFGVVFSILGLFVIFDVAKEESSDTFSLLLTRGDAETTTGA